MFKLEVNGAYRGRFKTAAEAMAAVEKLARPYRYRWKITDPYNRVYAQG